MHSGGGASTNPGGGASTNPGGGASTNPGGRAARWRGVLRRLDAGVALILLLGLLLAMQVVWVLRASDVTIFGPPATADENEAGAADS